MVGLVWFDLLLVRLDRFVVGEKCEDDWDILGYQIPVYIYYCYGVLVARVGVGVLCRNRNEKYKNTTGKPKISTDRYD